MIETKRHLFKVQRFALGRLFSVKYFFKMPHCMVPGCTNNSRNAKGVSYHRIPRDSRLRQAWMARIRRVNPRNVDHSFVCSSHFTPDCFEETLANLIPGYKRRARLKPNSVPSIFPHSKPETPRTTGQKREQIRTKRAKQEVKRWP